jgi:ATP-dependent Clp protease ATP-binding subunit ClpC
MFERFTDRSRRVLVYAQDEARQLNHDFIGTEHLLLGLIRERDGVAAKALDAKGVTYDVVRTKVAVDLSADTPSGSPPFTPRAKKVLELALREALQLGHNYIGTEHLLLGLVGETNGVAVRILLDLGVEPSDLREKVTELMSGQSGRELGGSPMPVQYNSATLHGVVRAVGQQLRPDLGSAALEDRVAKISDDLFDQLRRSWADEPHST